MGVHIKLLRKYPYSPFTLPSEELCICHLVIPTSVDLHYMFTTTQGFVLAQTNTWFAMWSLSSQPSSKPLKFGALVHLYHHLGRYNVSPFHCNVVQDYTWSNSLYRLVWPHPKALKAIESIFEHTKHLLNFNTCLPMGSVIAFLHSRLRVYIRRHQITSTEVSPIP